MESFQFIISPKVSSLSSNGNRLETLEKPDIFQPFETRFTIKEEPLKALHKGFKVLPPKSIHTGPESPPAHNGISSRTGIRVQRFRLRPATGASPLAVKAATFPCWHV